jgi:hypothetical protein
MDRGESKSSMGRGLYHERISYYWWEKGRLQLGDVYTCHEFLQRSREFEKTDSRKEFTSLLNNLLT